MARELPRTIRSLSPTAQRDIAADDYEIIIVDNGSTEPFDPEQCLKLGRNISFHRMADATPSPVPAINYGLSLARGNLIGVLIDGARMASPRLLATALEAAQLHRRPVIGALSFHLGPDVQMRSIAKGYCQDVEDRLLDSVDWIADGYLLFTIAVFAGSSADGWLVIPAETNALFLTSEHWQALGGYDPAFITVGGGLVNLDTWSRACADTTGRVVLLLGEATFHQIHGGIATNSTISRWQLYHDEYVRLRGKDYTRPTGTPLLVGRPQPSVLASLRISVEHQLQLDTKEVNMGIGENMQNDIAMPVDSVMGRPFCSSISAEVLERIQVGTMRTKYRNVPFFKSPFDISIYLNLLSRLAPRTVIEVGTKYGGSALWFADMMSAQGLEGARVVSVDIEPLANFTDPRIIFLKGDAKQLDIVLPPELLQCCPHPWLVIEDSSHYYAETIATLGFFHDHLQSGDYIVVEDGVVAQLPHERYRKYDNGPNRGVADFLSDHGDFYAIDTELCDLFGHNATYNPNGWLRRL